VAGGPRNGFAQLEEEFVFEFGAAFLGAEDLAFHSLSSGVMKRSPLATVCLRT
jgi:hypothetical protein